MDFIRAYKGSKASWGSNSLLKGKKIPFYGALWNIITTDCEEVLKDQQVPLLLKKSLESNGNGVDWDMTMAYLIGQETKT